MSDVNEKWYETEKFIIKGLLEDEAYFRKVVTNLKKEYFSSSSATILKVVKKYYEKYSKIPSYSVVKKIVQNASDNEKQIKMVNRLLQECKDKDFSPIKEEEWLFESTKDYVKEKSMYNFVTECAENVYSEEQNMDMETLSKRMQDIVSISWDEDLGVFYSDMMTFDSIYDTLEDMNQRIPLGIPKLDDAIGGGIINKSLNVIAGTAGTGKTMIMGNVACNAIKAGKNVIYISFEITKEHIHQRFTSTFTNLSMQKLVDMREEVKDRIRTAYEEKKIGEFVIAEFPPSSVTALQLDNYLNELKLKRNFSPDLIVVDYLGIMKPIDKNATSNYDKGKEVSENLRWLGYRHECPVITGSQNNRSAIGEMDVGMESLSDSFGIGMTADLIISITKPETLDEQSQLRFKITKSRMCKEGQFVIIDVDYDKMTLKCEHGGFESEAEEETKETVKAIRERKKRNREQGNPDELNNDGIIV
jgi:replicative DNA helicase